MDQVEIFKALSNSTRLQILCWLKNPCVHFTEEHEVDMVKTGVCVGLIQKKSGLSQSTVSEYLSILQRAGFIQSTRIGQWTYYRRNEEAITHLIRTLESDI
ncbi:helix-turn-helix transcriptional regulator [Dyadobacter sp. NIV53]|uniref:ArsR/SmtB family transcription factor n=1 Tax=Dyadobacter sp. NIV53 TaxID=2861765 RepID=UPI001C8730CF|nr:metalloregulator ArsR/SmtB family transcription factor [Dyadobacter sp. NIV53]